MWLSFKNSQPCPNAPDKTIAEILAERKTQNIDINILDDLMLATEVKTIQRNGIRFLNCDYFDERLYGFKSKALIKYNLFDLTSIKVYTTKGETIELPKGSTAIDFAYRIHTDIGNSMIGAIVKGVNMGAFFL